MPEHIHNLRDCTYDEVGESIIWRCGFTPKATPRGSSLYEDPMGVTKGSWPVPAIVWCDHHADQHLCSRDHGPDGHGGSSICCPRCSPDEPCEVVDLWHIDKFGECFVRDYSRWVDLGHGAMGVLGVNDWPVVEHPSNTLAGQMATLNDAARAFGREFMAQLQKLFGGPGAQWDAAKQPVPRDPAVLVEALTEIRDHTTARLLREWIDEILSQWETNDGDVFVDHPGWDDDPLVAFMQRIALALQPGTDLTLIALPTEDALVLQVAAWVRTLGEIRLQASEAIRLTEEYVSAAGRKRISWRSGWAVYDALHSIARIEPGERQAEAMAEGPWASQHIGQPMTDTCVLGCVLVGHHRYCMTLHGTDGGPPIRLPDGSVGYRFLIDGGERP